MVVRDEGGGGGGGEGEEEEEEGKEEEEEGKEEEGLTRHTQMGIYRSIYTQTLYKCISKERHREG